jgi:methylated-DNA-protein-cysteine methyltransferase related protein
MQKKRFGKVGGLSTLTFGERVVQIALSIPKGKVTTYGRIARAAGGGPLTSQSVTGILGKAYDRGEKAIPFHRIVYADGRIWIDERYREERMKKYAAEGLSIDAKGRVEDFEKKLFDPFAKKPSKRV